MCEATNSKRGSREERAQSEMYDENERTMTVVQSIVVFRFIILMLIFFAFRSWRFFSYSSSSRTIKINESLGEGRLPQSRVRTYNWPIKGLKVVLTDHLPNGTDGETRTLVLTKVLMSTQLTEQTRVGVERVGELERPLVSNDVDLAQEQSNDLTRHDDLDGDCQQNEAILQSSQTQGLVQNQRLPSASPHLAQGDRVVLDVGSEPLEDVLLGQTLKRPLVTAHKVELQKHVRPENQSQNLIFGVENDKSQESVPKAIGYQRSCLSLEVVSGPSSGLHFSVLSTSTARLPLTLGRVPPSHLILKDYEVSGKHAKIDWNSNKLRWELVDMGSLNGTLLNSRSISHPDSGSRQWGDPVELASGDTITVGTTSNIHVHISSQNESLVPFGVGMTSKPMSLRRGAKELPMQDVCYYQWPLPGIDQFGVFGICDGHGGVEAAKSASKILPEMVATILSDSVRRERVVSQHDASDVLKDAFSQTEACMSNNYEGCTATMLLVWADADENLFAQCANVGDSACYINVEGKQIKMTEDHKVTSYSERLRIERTGEPLKDGETRLCGLNLARMLGDKFVKQQDSRFSSEPYISQVVQINKTSGIFAILASDGLWDVVSFKRAIQLVVQTRERFSRDKENLAQNIADVLLNEAKTLRTKDNTSIIFLDFDSTSTISSCKVLY